MESEDQGNATAETASHDKEETAKSTENDETVPIEPQPEQPKPSDAKRKQLEASLVWYNLCMHAYIYIYGKLVVRISHM